MSDNKRFDELTEQHMKPSGKSDTVRGEIIRAVNRIGYRFYNDGDFIGIGYGNHTCNAAARYIAAHGNKEMVDILATIWNGEIHDSFYPTLPDDVYEERLEKLVDATARYADTDTLELDQEASDMFEMSEYEDEHYDDYMEEEEDWEEGYEEEEEWED